MQQEKDRSEVCLKKAKQLVTETEEKVQDEKDKIHEVEVQNEKYTVEYRTLQKYREDVTLMLDEVCVVVHTFFFEKKNTYIFLYR